MPCHSSPRVHPSIFGNEPDPNNGTSYNQGPLASRPTDRQHIDIAAKVRPDNMQSVICSLQISILPLGRSGESPAIRPNPRQYHCVNKLRSYMLNIRAAAEWSYYVPPRRLVYSSRFMFFFSPTRSSLTATTLPPCVERGSMADAGPEFRENGLPRARWAWRFARVSGLPGSSL